MSSAGRPAPAGRAAGKRGDGPDWDAMSDVDYWTELAADKPFNGDMPATPAAPARPTAGRRSADQGAGSRSSSPGRGEPGGQLPSRPRQPRPAPASVDPAHAPGRYAAEPATESIAALARLANQPPASQPPASQPRSSPPTSRQRPMSPPPISQPRSAPPPISQPHQQVRPLPAPLDDDPLTSPSFPAINTSDSRSYRTSRPSDGRSSDTQPGVRPAAAYNEPTQQFTAYPQAPARANGAPPSRYPEQAPAGPNSAPGGYPVQPAAPAAPAAPAGNPYGSFVSQPPARQDPGYAAYGSQPAPGADGWYSPSGGYLPADPVPNGSFAGGGATNGGIPNGGVTNGGGAYGYDQPAYPDLQAEAAYHQPAYQAVQYDQAGYGAQDAAYGRDAYQGYNGYGTGTGG
jgi:hypothetical protein